MEPYSSFHSLLLGPFFNGLFGLAYVTRLDRSQGAVVLLEPHDDLQPRPGISDVNPDGMEIGHGFDKA
jgi:hypothetical protein